MLSTIKVLVAYDTFAYREGLKAIIGAGDIEIVGEAVVAHSILLRALQPDVDVVVMGVSWHDDNAIGLDVIAQLKERAPEKWLVAIAETQGLVRKAKQAGADMAFTIRLSQEELCGAIRSRGGIYRYDAFISYSHADADWVQRWLMRRLRARGVRVCIDTSDFEPGASVVDEIERAVLQSRKTLLVLTPDYLAGVWTEFEHVLAQSLDPAARKRRVLPLLLKPVKLPLRLAALISLDFTTDRYSDSQLARLVAAIKPAIA